MSCFDKLDDFCFSAKKPLHWPCFNIGMDNYSDSTLCRKHSATNEPSLLFSLHSSPTPSSSFSVNCSDMYG